MLDREKIVKIEVTSAAGRKLVVAEKDQFTFPRLFVDDIPVNNIIIIRGKELPLFEIDTPIYVVTYMKNGDRIRYAASVKISLPYQLNVQLKNSYGTLMAERRKYFKVESDIDCKILGVLREDDIEEFDVPVDAAIKNISIGGIFLFGSEVSFSPQDTLLLSFKLDDSPVNITVNILRVQRNQDKQIEGYGCQFVNLEPSQEEAFAQFIYNIQLKKRIEQMEKEQKQEEAMKRIKRSDE